MHGGERVEKDICSPGDDAKISGFISPKKAGVFRHLVTVFYRNNQSTSSEVFQTIVEITGIAHRLIEISPAEIVLSPRSTDKSVESVVKIVNRTDRSIQINRPYGLPNGMDVELNRKIIQPNEELQLKCRLHREFDTEVRFVMRFETSLPSESSIDIPVQILPQERIVITPSEVHFGVVSRTQLLKKRKICLAVTGVKCDSVDLLKADTPSYIRLYRK